MGPAKTEHDSFVMDHVSQLAGLRTFQENLKEMILDDRKEADQMGARLSIVEKDLTVLKVKIATYSTIAVFVANVVYNLVAKLLGA